jgi:hypothetical protein
MKRVISVIAATAIVLSLGLTALACGGQKADQEEVEASAKEGAAKSADLLPGKTAATGDE